MRHTALFLFLLAPTFASASPPVASYIFPAGGQRGTTVDVRVGGLFLHEECGWEMLGQGVTISPKLKKTTTRWFEGPVLPLPDSQRQEDYPKDMAGTVAIDATAPWGARHTRLWTSQGVTSALLFMVGDLPEIIEDEKEGDPVPVSVTMPVTINGRIFPHQELDIWSIEAKKGQVVTAEVHAARLRSPLDARLEVRDARGRIIAENDDHHGVDPLVSFVAPADGTYFVQIQDTSNLGGQAYVYRLTLTNDAPPEPVYPLGGKRDGLLRCAVAGQSHAIKLTQAGVHWHEITHPVSSRAQRVLLDVDELTECHEGTPQDVLFPAVLNGRIAKPGEVDAWAFGAAKGEMLSFELRAARLGSRLDGVLVIVDDQSGKIIARAEAGAKDAEASLDWTAPANGRYVVQVQDRFASRGGPEYAYRLRVTKSEGPDFRLVLLSDPRQGTSGDAVTVTRGTPAKLKVQVDRMRGFKDKIQLEVKGLPEGVAFTPTEIKPNQNAFDLVFQATDKTPVQQTRIQVFGRAGALTRQAASPVALGEPALSDILLGVAIPTPFTIKGEYIMGFAYRGGVHRRPYTIVRQGYDGPIDVSLSDRQARHLQGVVAEPMVVPAGANEFSYAMTLPPWMELGRTCRVCVQGAATVKDFDGSLHRVCFHSVNQNEQFVAVVGPGRLALEVGRDSLSLKPGQSVSIPVRIKRSPQTKGSVSVTLVPSPYLKGVDVKTLDIPADQDAGALTVTAGGLMPAQIPMPTVVRATLLQNGEPVFAEVKIDLQPAPAP
jgi:hypothetical protein